MEASDVIRLLQLEPLPLEGGFFRRIYTSALSFPASRFFPGRAGDRFLGTSIYYLVTPEEFSALHRLDQDELFHFYLGDAVEMAQVNEAGELKTLVLGHRIDRGELVQASVPGLVWQGTRLRPGGKWALLGTTVIPGFDYADFQIGQRAALLAQFPQHRDVILRFTR